MKKGFTLIELLSVIILLGIIGLIAYPIVNNSIRLSEEKAYNVLISNLEEAAYNYSFHYDLGFESEKKGLDFEELISKGIIKETDLINPLTNLPLEGCITYYWNEVKSQYIFEYDNECSLQ